jgi:hypothetical protein
MVLHRENNLTTFVTRNYIIHIVKVKKMKRIHSLNSILLLLIATIVFVGCSSDNSTNGGSASAFYLIGLGTGFISFIIGCIWYSVLFGKTWQRLMGYSDEKVKSIFKPLHIIVALIAELVAALFTTIILYSLSVRIPLAVCTVMLIVVAVGHGVKLAIFDGKPAKIIWINEGYKIITILLFFGALTLFGKHIVF